MVQVRDFVYGNPLPDFWCSTTDVREAAFAHAQALAGKNAIAGRTMHFKASNG